MFVYIVDRRV